MKFKQKILVKIEAL